MSSVAEGKAATPEEMATVEADASLDVAAVLRGDRRITPRGNDRRRRPRKRVDLMGLPVDQLTESDTIETVLEAVRAGRGGCLFTPNLHHMQAFANGSDAAVYERSALLPGARLVVADGMPLIWASRLRGSCATEHHRHADHGACEDLAGESAESPSVGQHPGRLLTTAQPFWVTKKRATCQLTVTLSR